MYTCILAVGPYLFDLMLHGPDRLVFLKFQLIMKRLVEDDSIKELRKQWGSDNHTAPFRVGEATKSSHIEPIPHHKVKEASS